MLLIAAPAKSEPLLFAEWTPPNRGRSPTIRRGKSRKKRESCERLAYLRSALTADGWTTFCSALLPHALRVYVITDAMSTSERCAHDGILPPVGAFCTTPFVWPFSTTSIWCCSGPSTTLSPTSAGAPSAVLPVPFAWWHAAQFAVNTCSPCATRSFRSQTLFASCAAAPSFCFCSASHFA